MTRTRMTIEQKKKNAEKISWINKLSPLIKHQDGLTTRQRYKIINKLAEIAIHLIETETNND